MAIDLSSIASAVAGASVDSLSSSLPSVISSVRVTTSLLPPLDLVGSGGSGEAGAGLDLGSILRPKVEITLGSGNTLTYAPYGDPGEGSWIPFLATAGLCLYAAYYYGKTRRRS